jgi:hypothetical protein
MEIKKFVVLGICAIAIIGIGYAVHWNYMRQNNPEFRRKLSKYSKTNETWL